MVRPARSCHARPIVPPVPALVGDGPAHPAEHHHGVALAGRPFRHRHVGGDAGGDEPPGQLDLVAHLRGPATGEPRSRVPVPEPPPRRRQQAGVEGIAPVDLHDQPVAIGIDRVVHEHPGVLPGRRADEAGGDAELLERDLDVTRSGAAPYRTHAEVDGGGRSQAGRPPGDRRAHRRRRVERRHGHEDQHRGAGPTERSGQVRGRDHHHAGGDGQQRIGPPSAPRAGPAQAWATRTSPTAASTGEHRVPNQSPTAISRRRHHQRDEPRHRGDRADGQDHRAREPREVVVRGLVDPARRGRHRGGGDEQARRGHAEEHIGGPPGARLLVERREDPPTVGRQRGAPQLTTGRARRTGGRSAPARPASRPSRHRPRRWRCRGTTAAPGPPPPRGCRRARSTRPARRPPARRR